MAQEFLEHVSNLLALTPADHPDRSFLEEELQRGRLQVFRRKQQNFAPFMEILDLHGEKEHAIERAVEGYKNGDRSAKAISQTWADLWKVWGELLGIKPTFEPFAHDPKHLPQYEKFGRTLIYIPPEAAQSELFPFLGKLMNGRSSAPSTYKLRHLHNDQFGWLLAETGNNMPLPLPSFNNQTPAIYSAKLRMIEEGKLQVMTANTYLIADAFLKRTGQSYMDDGWSHALILGSRVEPWGILVSQVRYSVEGKVAESFVQKMGRPPALPLIRTVSLRYK